MNRLTKAEQRGEHMHDVVRTIHPMQFVAESESQSVTCMKTESELLTQCGNVPSKERKEIP